MITEDMESIELGGATIRGEHIDTFVTMGDGFLVKMNNSCAYDKIEVNTVDCTPGDVKTIYNFFKYHGGNPVCECGFEMMYNENTDNVFCPGCDR